MQNEEGGIAVLKKTAERSVSLLHADATRYPVFGGESSHSLLRRGLAHNKIAAQLSISEATVKIHLVRIFGELGADDRTGAVTTAIERGIIRLAE